MNFGKFAKTGKKRLHPFFKLPAAQRKLFQSLKDRDSDLFPQSTLPPSPQNHSEDEEAGSSFSITGERNPFLPTEFEIDPSIFRGNDMSASQQSIADSILASDSQDDGGNDDEFIPRNDSDQTNIQDTNHLNFVPPSPVPAIFNSGKSSIGLDGRPRSSSSNLTQRILIKKLFV